MGRLSYMFLFIVATGVFVSSLLVGDPPDHTPIISRMTLLIVQLAVILFAAKLGGEFFSKVLKMPSVLGELMAGVAIGPYALGQMYIPLLHSPLFPDLAKTGLNFPVSAELYGVATLAAVVLLFLAGLETDFHQFIKRSLGGTLVGVGGVAGAFVLGDLLTVQYFHYIGQSDIGFMSPMPLFMGTISVATSVGITARVLSEQNQLDSAEGATILAGAVIDDVLGIIILAVVVGMAGSASGAVDWGKIGMIGYKAFGFWIGVTAMGILAAPYIQKFLLSFNSESTMMALGLGLALLVSGLAESVGLAAIIGAYSIGLGLSKEKISHKLEHSLSGIYHCIVPVFFCVMGMLVDLSALGGKTEVVVFAFIYTAVAIVAKVIGCGLPTYLVGFNTKGALRVGLGMLPRGEVALIVAGVGLASKVIGPDMFAVAIIMTLITTLLAPPLLVKAFDGTPGLKADEKEPEEVVDDEIKRERSYHMVIDNIDPAYRFAVVKSLTQTLEEKDYTVRAVSVDPRIFQVSKDNLSIEIEEEHDKIYFDLPQEERERFQEVINEGLANLKRKITQLVTKERSPDFNETKIIDMEAVKSSEEGKREITGDSDAPEKNSTDSGEKPSDEDGKKDSEAKDKRKSDETETSQDDDGESSPDDEKDSEDKRESPDEDDKKDEEKSSKDDSEDSKKSKKGGKGKHKKKNKKKGKKKNKKKKK